MAETRRTLAEVLTLLATNTNGEISATDLRDAVVSLSPCFGAVNVSTPAATTIAIAGTYYAAAGAGAIQASARGMDSPSGLRLRYTEAPDRVLRLEVTATLECVASATLGLQIRKNGAVVSGLSNWRGYTPADKPVTISVSVLVDASENDYFDVFVTNESTTDSVTVSAMHFSAEGIIG